MKIIKKDSNKLANWQFLLMMSVGIVVWALAFPFIKIGLRELSFINLTILRFFVVCVSFLIILTINSKKFSKLQKKDIFPIFLLGFIGVIAYHLGLNYGENYISAGVASLIIATIPIFIVIFAAIILKEKIGLIKSSGVILALSGVIIISIWGRKGATIEGHHMLGLLTILMAAIFGALYTIAGKKILERYNALSLTVYAMILGSLGLIPFLHPIINNTFIQEIANLSNTGWFVVIFLGVFSTVVGYTIWYIGLSMRNASELGVFLYAIPVLSTVFSYILFGDQITIMYILGGSLVIIGLIIVNKKRNKTNEKID